MIKVKEYLVARINSCCSLPLKDFLWLVDNAVYSNTNARKNIRPEVQIKPNLTRTGWNYFVNSAVFIESPVRTKEQFLEVVDSGRLDCSFLEDFINSIEIGVATLSVPITEKTIIRNFIVDCKSGALPEFMVKAEYTNDEGLILASKIEGLNLFDVVDVAEESLLSFIGNALAYDYSENDLIVLSGEGNGDNMFFFVGGDKLDVNNYRPVRFGRVPISNVIGLEEALENKLDIDGRNMESISDVETPEVGHFAYNSNRIPSFWNGEQWIPFGGNTSSSVNAITNRIKNVKNNSDGIPDGWTLMSDASTVDEVLSLYDLNVKKGFKVLIPFENIYKHTANVYWYLTIRSKKMAYALADEEDGALKIKAVRSSQPNNEMTPAVQEITRLDDLIIIKLMFDQNSAFEYADGLIFHIDENSELIKDESVVNVGYFQLNELRPSLFEDASGISNGVKMTGSFQNGTLFNGIYD